MCINDSELEIEVCIDCLEFVKTGSVGDELSISEASMILGGIKENWPSNRFKLEIPVPCGYFISDDPCDCCGCVGGDDNRYIINAMVVN